MASSSWLALGSAEKPACRDYGPEEKAKRAELRRQETEARRKAKYTIESCQPCRKSYYTAFPSKSVLETDIAEDSAGKPVEEAMEGSAGKPVEESVVPRCQAEHATVQAEDASQPCFARRCVEDALQIIPYVPATTQPTTILLRLDSGAEIRKSLFHPLRGAVGGEFPDWILPETFNVQGVEVPLASLEQVIRIDWNRVFFNEPAVLQSLRLIGAESWRVQFYADEPDPTPPKWPDRPRLDIVLHFADGTYVRYHPSALPIWSTEAMPTAAMIIRMRRKANLLKRRR